MFHRNNNNCNQCYFIDNHQLELRKEKSGKLISKEMRNRLQSCDIRSTPTLHLKITLLTRTPPPRYKAVLTSCYKAVVKIQQTHTYTHTHTHTHIHTHTHTHTHTRLFVDKK